MSTTNLLNKKKFCSYTLYKHKNPKTIQLNPIKKIKRIKKIKNHLSLRETVESKFYKSLKRNWTQSQKNFNSKYIDKNTFNFNVSDEYSDTLKRVSIKQKGIKHKNLSIIAQKKVLEKINSAKQFRNKMEIMLNNLEIIKKKMLEEKQKMKEITIIRKIKIIKNLKKKNR